ncbi:MAG: YdeI/OmpD-associated family protein [Myxococcota bacterium]
MAQTFTAQIVRGTEKDTMGIVVPDAVVAALGKGRRPPVTVTIQGYSWRSTVAVMGGQTLLGIAAVHRAHLDLDGRDAIEVTLALDEAPRDTPVPDDLRAALEANGCLATFEALSPSRRKEAVRQVEDAKTAATRERRIAKVVASLG